MNKIKIAILGATGLVGQQFINILSEHPFFSIETLITSERNTGKQYKEAVSWKAGRAIPESIATKKIDKFSISELKNKGVNIIFSALPATVSLNYEKELREEGFFVFSNSSSYRMHKDVPIIVPDVNPEHLNLIKLQRKKYGGFIITNPNCSTSGIVTILKPLSEFGLDSVYISTYQSISGGGLNGVSSIDILNNIFPYIKDEEQKIEIESRKILGNIEKETINEPEFKIVSNCCRVPILYSHFISMMINLKQDIPLKTIKEKLSAFSNLPKELELPTAPENSIEIFEEPERPQPALDFPIPFDKKNGMVVKVGRVEKVGKTLKLFILFNNTVKGAAGASVLNAELAVKSGLAGRL